MFEFTKDTIVYEVMLNAPQAAPMFEKLGMHCLGCAYATGESIEQACNAHGVDPEKFMLELKAFLADKAE